MASKSTRPFKLWCVSRLKKVSLIASSFKELKIKGCDKFKLDSDDNMTIVLEEDGTEVDEEEYFGFLPANTVLMMLVGTQKWTPRGSGDSIDEPDTSALGFESDLDPGMSSLLTDLHKDVTKVITLSDEQLQEIIDMDSTRLAHYFGGNERFVKSLQEGCQRHLDDRSQTSEVISLLKLYHKSQSIAGQEVDGAGEAKRMRLADDT